MAEPLPVDYLQPDEAALVKERRQLRSILDGWIFGGLLWCGALGLAIFLGVGLGLFLPVGLPIVIGSTILYGTFLIASFRRAATSLYLLTPERVYRASGRMLFHLQQTTYDKITDLHVRQGPFGRRYGFGTVRLETAGAGLVIPGVRDPFGFKREVEEARARFLQTLVGEYRKTSKAGKKAAPSLVVPREAEALWSAGPSPGSLVGRVAQGAFFLLVGAAVLFSTLLFVSDPPPQLIIFPSVFLVIGLLRLVSALLHFRHTKYHVTDRGVAVASGWLTKRRVETTFEKVTDVTTQQSPIGRLLDYGIIRINTAGSAAAPVVFDGMKDPEGVKALIDRAREKARRHA